MEKRKGRRRPGLGSRGCGVHEPGGPPVTPTLPPVLCPSQLKDSPCILAAAITSPAEMLDTLTR